MSGGLVTTNSDGLAPVKPGSRRKRALSEAQSETKKKAGELVESSFQAGYTSAEATLAARAYVAGVGLQIQQTTAAGLKQLSAIMGGDGLTSGIDDEVIEAAIASLKPTPEVSDWGELL
jgi:hypothetical protein